MAKAEGFDSRRADLRAWLGVDGGTPETSALSAAALTGLPFFVAYNALRGVWHEAGEPLEPRAGHGPTDTHTEGAPKGHTRCVVCVCVQEDTR